jgi:hypothetical protein
MKLKLMFAPLVLIAACTIARYSYNGQFYSTAPAMLAAQKQHLAQLLREVAPRSKPLAADCRVVLPDRDTVQAKGVMSDGSLSQAALNPLVDATYADDYFKAQVIEKRHVCARTSIAMGNGRRVTPDGDEVMIYLHMPEVSIADWYVVRKGREPMRIPFDDRILDDDQHLRDWLLRLERKILELSS